MKASNITISFSITEELDGMRLDKAVSFCPEIVSRSQGSKLISQKAVKLNGLALKPSFHVESGQLLTIEMPDPVASQLQPYDFPLEIIFEDDDLMVINKPAGLVVHPAHGHAHDTLINVLVFHRKDLSLGFQENRPGLVHRLDRDTSGTMIIAKNDFAQASLAKQFERKTTHRRYRAILLGVMKEDSGRIESLLSRHPTDRKRFSSIEDPQGVKARLAITHFTVLERSDFFTLVELKLETGRTHQIRVHLSEKGFPVVGDETYGGKKRASNHKSLRVRDLVAEMPRFALHAYELGFVHPRSGKQLYFTAPWPEDLRELLTLSKLTLPEETSETDQP